MPGTDPGAGGSSREGVSGLVPAGGTYVRIVKPLLDRVVALIGLLVLFPLFCVIGAAVRIESRGGVFYRQERVGFLGRGFRMAKFRSMVVGAEHQGGGILVERNDPRVTRVGKVLRATSLDELPQLWNVLRGEMSIVGPRPTLLYQVEQYDREQMQRLRLRPGLTGLAQVRGRKGIPWDERIKLDLAYLDSVSLAVDFGIVCSTFAVLARRHDPPAQGHFWKGGEGKENGASEEGGAEP